MLKNEILQLFEIVNYDVKTFLHQLKRKENKLLNLYYKDIKQKTCYFNIKQIVTLQTLYNIKNDITTFPLYSDGGLKTFKSMLLGYYTEEEYNKQITPVYLNFIKDLQYILPALKHLQVGNSRYLNNPLIVKCLKKYFSEENYNIIPKKHIFTYIKLGIDHPLYCLSCGTLILYPNTNIHHCGNEVCIETYNIKTLLLILTLIKKYFLSTNKRDMFTLDFIVKHNIRIQEFCIEKLKPYFSLLQLNNMTSNQKCYHILYDIHLIPLCKNCHKNKVVFDVNKRCYKSTCSHYCNNRYIKNIEKRLKNNTEYGSVGKNLYYIINDLFPNNNFKKGKIGPFCPDFIDEANKTIYEINETYHTLNKKLKNDKRKYGYLKSLGWRINVIFDFYDQKLTRHYFNKIHKIAKEEYKDLVNSVVIYVKQLPKILTDTGWSNFQGVIKYGNKDVITLKNGIVCTKDHKIYDQNMHLKNASLYLHELLKLKQNVYDIINVLKNNRFLINGKTLVHNCLILDEFAFLSPGLLLGFMNSVFPVVSSSKTSQIIVVSTPNGMNNLYYNIWNKAMLNVLKDHLDVGWFPYRIDWWDVPGRDEKWKQVQLATFNGNILRFQQEYGNCLISNTLLKLRDYRMDLFTITIELMFNRIKLLNNQFKYLVDTPDGFKPFMGIAKNRKECVKIYLENKTSIGCSVDHPFMHLNGLMIRAFNLKDLKRYLLDRNNNRVKITKIIKLGEQDCYDLINVGLRHIFYANNILTHNSFLGSVSTLVKGARVSELRKQVEDRDIKYQRIQLHKNYPNTLVNIYYPPQKNRAYVIGADPSTGSDSDFQAMSIWDVTNTFDIKMVASFYLNDVPPKIFAYILCKLGTIYNNAYIAILNNGVSFATLDYLFREFEYLNIIHLGGNPKTSIGIVSNADRKFDACINFKEIILNPIRKIEINDGRLIDLLLRFLRHNRGGKVPAYYATKGHDDFVMCSVWAFYILKPELLLNYYNINQYIQDKLGKDIPLFVTSMLNVSLGLNLQFIRELDSKFNLTNTNYLKSISQLSTDINKNYLEIAKQFSHYDSVILEKQLDNNTDNFDFMGFSS